MRPGPLALVVDDEKDLRDLLAEILRGAGLETLVAAGADEAIELARQHHPRLVFLDLVMPRRNGLDALPELKALDPGMAVIILTAQDDIPTVVRAVQLGAYDYLTKPVDPRVITLAVRRALEHRSLLDEVAVLRERTGAAAGLRGQMGPGNEVARLVEQVAQVAPTSFTVLIQGETGTGKELVARALHQQSQRRDRPFVALDCGAIPETLIEAELFGHEKGAFTGADRRREGHFVLADGGTLFLDEIGNLPVPTQGKLLRVLQERQVQALGGRQPRPVDVRIVAASNARLEDLARSGQFRQDLYYRLGEFTISLPPLRERPEDIPYLAQRFVEEAAMDLARPVSRISPAALEALGRHAWPGNVRELRNVMRQAVLRGGELIEPEHLGLSGGPPPGRAPASGTAPPAPGTSLKEVARAAAAEAERRAIRDALQAAGGNKSEAARLLRTDFKTLHLKIKQLGILSREDQGTH
jgi:DNA-binding NtrC family response regulator